MSSLFCYLSSLFCYLSSRFWYLCSPGSYLFTISPFWLLIHFSWNLEARPLFSDICPAGLSNIVLLQPCLIRYLSSQAVKYFTFAACLISVHQAVKYCTFAALSDICPTKLPNIVPLQPCLISVQPGCQILYLCSPVWHLSSARLSNIVPLQPCLISVQPGCQILYPYSTVWYLSSALCSLSR